MLSLDIVADLSLNEFREVLLEWSQTTMPEATANEDIIGLIGDLASEGAEDYLITFVEFMTEASMCQQMAILYESHLMCMELLEGSVQFVIDTLNPDYYQLVRGIIDLTTNDESTSISIINLRNHYDKDDLDEGALRSLSEAARTAQNNLMLTYLSDMLSIADTFAAIPIYIDHTDNPMIHLELVSSLVYPEDLEVNNLSTIDDDIDYICSNTPIYLDKDDVREQVTSKLRRMSTDDRRELIRWCKNNTDNLELSFDMRMFKVLGPCLTDPKGYNLGKDMKHLCSRFGGCRMFTCTCSEYYGEEDNEGNEGRILKLQKNTLSWFTGKCAREGCGLNIRRFHHAVRRPLITGGWSECFCSFRCVKLESIKSNDESDEAQLLMINTFSDWINGIGIEDRL